MHLDTIGSFNESLGGSKFAAVFTDDYSGMVFAVPMKSKADVVSVFSEIIAMRKQMDTKLCD